MEKTLKVINDLERLGIIERYAMGGGMAVLYYVEPVLTYDLDVFVFLPREKGRKEVLITLEPIYKELKGRGYRVDREHILVEGVPVQFLPAYNPLVEEAVSEARSVRYGKVGSRVVRVEHLIAILLQTGRPKDEARILQLREEAKIDGRRLTGILARHGLKQRWAAFSKRYEF